MLRAGPRPPPSPRRPVLNSSSPHLPGPALPEGCQGLECFGGLCAGGGASEAAEAAHHPGLPDPSLGTLPQPLFQRPLPQAFQALSSALRIPHPAPLIPPPQLGAKAVPGPGWGTPAGWGAPPASPSPPQPFRHRPGPPHRGGPGTPLWPHHQHQSSVSGLLKAHISKFPYFPEPRERLWPEPGCYSRVLRFILASSFP